MLFLSYIVLGVIGLLAQAPFARELVTDVLDVPARAARLALTELVDYGLLVPLGTAYEVSHPLIHTYARRLLAEHTDAVQRRALVARLVTELAAHFPRVEPTTWANCELLVPHIQVCATQMEPQQDGLAEAATLFMQAGAYLLARGQYEQAEELYTRALAIREQVLEPEHADLASSLDRLASVYRRRGKYEQAVPLFQRAIAIGEKTLDPEHPALATRYDNLASLYSEQGRYQEAEPLFQRALAIYEKMLGPEHPDTATTLYCLAYLCQKQGRHEQAESLYQRTLAIYERAFPPDHPSILGILGHYASLLRAMNRPREAHALEQRASAVRARRTPGNTP